MIYLVASGGGLPLVEKARQYLPEVGKLFSPGWNWVPPHCTYACDNGVYTAFTQGRYWGEGMEKDYLKMLSCIPGDFPPLWVLLPDVVADWNATLALAQIYLPILRGYGIKTAIALQDGCDFHEAAALDTDAVFVAGSTEWKLANIHPATEFFHRCEKWVHAGRVNTAKRLRLCLRAGVDSCDGTGINKFFDNTAPRLSRCWQQEIRQPGLQI